jgi:hypothetical protein
VRQQRPRPRSPDQHLVQLMLDELALPAFGSVGETPGAAERRRPSSSPSRRSADSTTSSPGPGWLQQVLAQMPGKWYLVSARCWRSNSPSGEKTKTEKARCSMPGARCAAALSAIAVGRPPSSTSTTVVRSVIPDVLAERRFSRARC